MLKLEEKEEEVIIKSILIIKMIKSIFKKLKIAKTTKKSKRKRLL